MKGNVGGDIDRRARWGQRDSRNEQKPTWVKYSETETASPPGSCAVLHRSVLTAGLVVLLLAYSPAVWPKSRPLHRTGNRSRNFETLRPRRGALNGGKCSRNCRRFVYLAGEQYLAGIRAGRPGEFLQRSSLRVYFAVPRKAVLLSQAFIGARLRVPRASLSLADPEASKNRDLGKIRDECEDRCGYQCCSDHQYGQRSHSNSADGER